MARRHDDGSVLPIVMVIVTILAAFVVAAASYSMTNLRYGNVTEARSDRLAAADAGMRYAIDQIALRNAGCIIDTQSSVLPGVEADFNGATAEVTCERITSGFEGIQAYAAVMTGEGLAPGQALLVSQSGVGGDTPKTLGGPVYMTRIDNNDSGTLKAFDLSPPVLIENGPLFYHDPSPAPCTPVKAAELPTQISFEPELIFGPACVSVPWYDHFDSPAVPDLTTLPVRNGTLELTDPSGFGSYTDVSGGGGGCRVFEPGRYIEPPDIDGKDSYFKSGVYLFDFQGVDQTLIVRQGILTAGVPNPVSTPSLANEIPDNSAACYAQQSADVVPVGEEGAAFYFAGNAHIQILTQGSAEIHARRSGANYVSVQALCAPNGGWCNIDGDGGTATPSLLTAPGNGSMPDLLYTQSGNNKQFVAHGLVYAPLAEMEFGNVTASATQRLLGGLVVSRLVLQSSASATNFEISVPTSPITAKIELTSTAVKNGATTSIRAIIEYRPYADQKDDRVRINSWRVCSTPGCT